MFAGIDSHKDTLAVVIVDSSGRQVAASTVPNDPAGLEQLPKLLADHGVVMVGIECSGTYGRPAAVALSNAGTVEVREVPASMTVRERNRKPAAARATPSTPWPSPASSHAATGYRRCAACPAWPMTCNNSPTTAAS